MQPPISPQGRSVRPVRPVRPVRSVRSTRAGRSRAARIASVASGGFLVLANLLTAFMAALAVLTRPEGPWDHHGLQGITTMGVLAAAMALLVLLLTLVPVLLRWLHPFWLFVPAVLLVAALARLEYVDATWPEDDAYQYGSAEPAPAPMG
ncbi:hypothetical protein DEF23_08590 [Marinitenerispora sediminis]|uniref:Uncharacterized protein n=2 Tax=Marinitenerispora sediminis TaxID=1931232 RepID=A0A368T5P9_9ACTN|nr:hypothetical protein DEF28_10685 [Marinitenerispora sediminis]RCV58516.1 hypothetical protein DEF23_08590 [Marinitenerispora sediminis]RCV58866.1 hypothetical protein DEF24_12010 [Marinitenerispora sediminis]